jgi:hypothetical protein
MELINEVRVGRELEMQEVMFREYTNQWGQLAEVLLMKTRWSGTPACSPKALEHYAATGWWVKAWKKTCIQSDYLVYLGQACRCSETTPSSRLSCACAEQA